MGTQDCVAAIDKILQVTGYSSVSYIGHSEGNTQLMAGGALMPEYFNEKINLAVFFAPPVSMMHAPDKEDRILSDPKVMPGLIKVLEDLHLYNIIPYGSLFAGATSKVCQIFNGSLCKFALNYFAGGDSKVDCVERVPVMLSYLPSGAGYLNDVHYGQLIHAKTETFRRFDHGKAENQKRYHQDTPPDYDLSKVKFPIAVFAGLKDVLADPEDVKWFQKVMKDQIVFSSTQLPFDHLTFAFARDMSFFTKDTMALVNHYNNKCDDSTLDSNFAIGNEKCLNEKKIKNKVII